MKNLNGSSIFYTAWVRPIYGVLDNVMPDDLNQEDRVLREDCNLLVLSGNLDADL